MKKYLLGIVLFVVGLVLMIGGIVMQLTMTPNNAGQTGNSGNEEYYGEEGSDLQDISTFDFSAITSAVLMGQVNGYLVACNNDVKVPSQIGTLSMKSVLDNVNTAVGYRVSDVSTSTCAPVSFVVGTLTGTEFTSKMLEVEPKDSNSILLVYDNTTYEFVFNEDISTLLSNLS